MCDIMGNACIFYRYGVHLVCIDTTADDLAKLLDDLSGEFEIVKDFSHTGRIEYYLINYCDDLDLIGILHTDE